MLPLLKVYSAAEETNRNKLFLSLQEDPYGVTIRVCSKSGAPLPQGVLLRIEHNGTIRTFQDINPCFGFNLDRNGALFTTKEKEEL